MSDSKDRLTEVLLSNFERLGRLEDGQLAQVKANERIERKLDDVIRVLTGLSDGLGEFQYKVGEDFSRMGAQVNKNTSAIQQVSADLTRHERSPHAAAQ